MYVCTRSIHWLVCDCTHVLHIYVIIVYEVALECAVAYACVYVSLLHACCCVYTVALVLQEETICDSHQDHENV